MHLHTSFNNFISSAQIFLDRHPIPKACETIIHRSYETLKHCVSLEFVWSLSTNFLAGAVAGNAGRLFSRGVLASGLRILGHTRKVAQFEMMSWGLLLRARAVNLTALRLTASLSNYLVNASVFNKIMGHGAGVQNLRTAVEFGLMHPGSVLSHQILKDVSPLPLRIVADFFLGAFNFAFSSGARVALENLFHDTQDSFGAHFTLEHLMEGGAMHLGNRLAEHSSNHIIKGLGYFYHEFISEPQQIAEAVVDASGTLTFMTGIREEGRKFPRSLNDHQFEDLIDQVTLALNQGPHTYENLALLLIQKKTPYSPHHNTLRSQVEALLFDALTGKDAEPVLEKIQNAFPLHEDFQRWLTDFNLHEIPFFEKDPTRLDDNQVQDLADILEPMFEKDPSRIESLIRRTLGSDALGLFDFGYSLNEQMAKLIERCNGDKIGKLCHWATYIQGENIPLRNFRFSLAAPKVSPKTSHQLESETRYRDLENEEFVELHVIMTRTFPRDKIRPFIRRTLGSAAFSRLKMEGSQEAILEDLIDEGIKRVRTTRFIEGLIRISGEKSHIARFAEKLKRAKTTSKREEDSFQLKNREIQDFIDLLSGLKLASFCYRNLSRIALEHEIKDNAEDLVFAAVQEKRIRVLAKAVMVLHPNSKAQLTEFLLNIGKEDLRRDVFPTEIISLSNVKLQSFIDILSFYYSSPRLLRALSRKVLLDEVVESDAEALVLKAAEQGRMKNIADQASLDYRPSARQLWPLLENTREIDSPEIRQIRLKGIEIQRLIDIIGPLYPRAADCRALSRRILLENEVKENMEDFIVCATAQGRLRTLLKQIESDHRRLTAHRELEEMLSLFRFDEKEATPDYKPIDEAVTAEVIQLFGKFVGEDATTLRRICRCALDRELKEIIPIEQAPFDLIRSFILYAKRERRVRHVLQALFDHYKKAKEIEDFASRIYLSVY